MYWQRNDATAVVHLHSTHSVAVSILADVDPNDVLPPLTAYFVMRVGSLPLAPYFPPGDAALAKAVEKLAGRHHAVLLANHGPVVAGSSLANAQFAAEELEETAKAVPHAAIHADPPADAGASERAEKTISFAMSRKGLRDVRSARRSRRG